MRPLIKALAVLIYAAGVSASCWAEPTSGSQFRVCADPNNMPFSNSAGEGFENKLAEMIAQTFGQELS